MIILMNKTVKKSVKLVIIVRNIEVAWTFKKQTADLIVTMG